MKDESEKTCVIGSGFAGLSMCGSLKRHGIPFDCFEKNDKVKKKKKNFFKIKRLVEIGILVFIIQLILYHQN